VILFFFGGIWDAVDFKGCAPIHVTNNGHQASYCPKKKQNRNLSLPVAFKFSSARVHTITSLLHHKFWKYYIATSSDIEYQTTTLCKNLPTQYETATTLTIEKVEQ
jgi:hypothetical protein